VLAMLHQLAAARSTREVWWIRGARGPQEHPLAAEAHALLASLPRAREHVFYSATAGRLSKDTLLALDVPVDANAYICGPASFMTDMRDALSAAGNRRPTERCSSAAPSPARTSCWTCESWGGPASPRGLPG
jgi:ferredoxin-NADP reductase